ncbi:hypothetical protein [Rhodopila sp.]|uniref:hypothetical protein n=1 Tax=Rhodopila sp. TaxID=2480087 RepID=UPI003D0A23AE
MTIAPYSLLNNTAVTGSVYKNNIDNNSVAAQRIVGRFAPHAQTSPNMTIMLDAGSLFDGTTLTEKTAQSTGTITAPASHPRIDRVVIDNVTGVASVVTGTEAVSPTPPAIPSGKSPVAQILLQTSTTSITNAIITDERNFAALSPGGFGAQGSISSASTCDLGSILSRNVMITGTTTITSFGSSAALTSPIYLIEFTAALTLTHSSNLLCPGLANIVTAAGDTAIVEYLGSGAWRIRTYQRVSGKPLVSSTPTYQYLTSGTTYTRPAGVTSILVEMVGGGGGGGGYGGSRYDGGNGGATNFDTIYAVGGGGGGGFSSTAYPGPGGTGGSGSADKRRAGQAGSFIAADSTTGGNSEMGFGAAGTVTGGAASSAAANSGGGGGGGASGSGSINSSGSGAGGEYARKLISSPASTYTFNIGYGGSAGGGTNPGGSGGSGYIEVTEYY